MADPLHPLLLSQLRQAQAQAQIELDIERNDASGWVELLQNVSDAYVDADASRLSQARLNSLIELSSHWIWECDADGHITYSSDLTGASLGVEAPHAIGAAFSLDPTVNSLATIAALQAMLQAGAPFQDFTFAVRPHEAGLRWVCISGLPLQDAAGVHCGFRIVGADVTRLQLADRQMQQLAQCDSLTGLANRDRLFEELQRMLERAGRRPFRFALLFMDLDRFKAVNDSLGHAAGDALLTVIAARLRDRLRGGDVLARYGSDEFVALAEGRCTPESLAHVAGKLLAEVAAPVCIQGREFEVSCSIGISVFPDDGRDADTLLKHADAAMHRAKARGKNGFHCYTSDLSGQAAYQFTLEADLRQAIRRNELLLHFQPRFRMSDSQICGMEALLRWQHPQRGLLGPDEFIPVAEESGLIVPIGRWVITATCRQMRLWHDAGMRPPACAVNLSARQLAVGGLVDDVAGALADSALQGSDLEVEVTESVLMADPVLASTILQRLHVMGVQAAIDDFGTGHSALSYLKRFPAGTVKIDRSFVRGLPTDPDDAAITRAVVAMSHSLGLRVVAEGIETQAQLQFLTGIGCDEAQGYLLGRPVSAVETGALLRAALN